MLDRYKNDFFKLDYDCILTEDVKQNNRKINKSEIERRKSSEDWLTLG